MFVREPRQASSFFLACRQLVIVQAAVDYIDDKFFPDIWARHFPTRHTHPLSRILIRRIVQLIYQEQEKGRSLDELLQAHAIASAEFALAESENRTENH